MVLPAAGSTTMLEPDPAEVPPHEPVNHCQLAPNPRPPPVTVNVFGVPAHVLLLVIDIPVGATDGLPIAIPKVLAVLVPQLLPAVTVMFPVCPTVHVIDVVPEPEVIVHPVGTVHE